MRRRLIVAIEHFPVAGIFTIARGGKTSVDVVTVTIHEGIYAGRGEATAIYYLGEDAQSVATQISAIGDIIESGVDRAFLQESLPHGAARNAVDSAMWDLEARISGIPVWHMPGLAKPAPLMTAYTLSLDTPDVMERNAQQAAEHYPLLKLKLAGEEDVARVAAVRRGAPNARLIVDANESWTERDVTAEAAALEPYGVELIEQPVRAGMDHLLERYTSPIPLCADESCQDRSDLRRCIGRYSAINIKLDKTGGLTEALALAAEAEEMGFSLMVGCMLSTSLGIAPASLLAHRARWIDLDGPLLLRQDRPDGFTYDGGMMLPPAKGFWG